MIFLLSWNNWLHTRVSSISCSCLNLSTSRNTEFRHLLSSGASSRPGARSDSRQCSRSFRAAFHLAFNGSDGRVVSSWTTSTSDHPTGIYTYHQTIKPWHTFACIVPYLMSEFCPIPELYFRMNRLKTGLILVTYKATISDYTICLKLSWSDSRHKAFYNEVNLSAIVFCEYTCYTLTNHVPPDTLIRMLTSRHYQTVHATLAFDKSHKWEEEHFMPSYNWQMASMTEKLIDCN